MTARIWVALGIVYVVWGSTYLGIRVVVETMPPLLTSCVRFVLAAAIIVSSVAVIVRRESRAEPELHRRRDPAAGRAALNVPDTRV